ncbi:helix-turn-helix domain-containing protein [Streptococcus sp. S784/96/1]|nr:helix-turn-helix domain-containing protein [Streptococcus sp. S784/96/1]
MFLGDKIRLARLARLAENDSQEKLAEKIGVSRQTVIN